MNLQCFLIVLPAMVITAFLILRMRGRSERALAESEGRFHSFFDTAAVGFVDVDPVTHLFLNANAKMEELTGYSVAELKTMTFTDITYPDDRETNFRDYQALVDRKSPGQYSVEKRYVRKDGQLIWVLVTAVIQKSITGTGYRTSSVVQDITQRKRMEEERLRFAEELKAHVEGRTRELRKANAFLNVLVENIPDVMFVKEAKALRFTRVNKSWENLFGHSNEEVVGKNDYDLFPKEEADFFIAKDREVLASGKLLDIPSEPVHARFKGKRIFHTKKVPIYDEKGQPEYLLGLAEDITEKKQAEEDRQNLLLEKVARSESERALKLRDEFISIAAHELKTPLTALNLQVQLLGRFLPQVESSKTTAFQNILRGSQDQLDRFALLVDKLLDVSRASAGQLVIEKAEENLSEIVLRVVKKYESELDRARCSLELHLESSLTGFWDGTRMEQILVNLLSNAMKYGAGQPIEVTTLSQGDNAILKVKDRGIGIAKEDCSRIFDRFERAVSTRSFGGFGLGLFISRQIAAAHGGSIRVESELGSGSCFVVELPRLAQPQPAAST